MHCNIRRISLSSPIGVGDSPKGPEHRRHALILENFQAGPFGEPDLALPSDSVTRRLVRTNLDESGMPPKRARGIVINEEAVASTTKSKKVPPKVGKGKGKAPVDERLEYNSGSDGESFDSQASFSELDDDKLLQTRRTEIRAKARPNPSRIPESTPLATDSVPSPEHAVVPTPPVQGPPP
uniref:Integrase core domain containing protein n=1 Tax=Solanum tuberosum TaxID=4113 RepID=M1D9U2_SOLTU